MKKSIMNAFAYVALASCGHHAVHGLNPTGHENGVAVMMFANSTPSPTLPFNRVESTWKVPMQPPGGDDSIVAVWPGLQNNDNGIVLQPVLVWGDVGGGVGGNFWSAIAWIQEGSTAYYSPPFRVYPGEWLTGTVWATYCTDPSHCVWRVQIRDVYTGVWYYVDRYESVPMTSAVALTNETIRLSVCNQLPPNDSVDFSSFYAYKPVGSDMMSYQAMPTSSWVWYNYTHNPECNYSGGYVDEYSAHLTWNHTL